MTETYRKIAHIRAERFDGSKEMIAKYNIQDSRDSGYNDTDCEDEGLCIPTYEGWLRIDSSDWIATGIDGEHWVIDDTIFRKTYEEVNDDD
ncbi:hypothetical protein GPK34_00130 [Secundilactobacillus kimchicus]|uniref:hypothetical protein n=1 Tax=Secundilactobacillus kimchicus TaxID=528209 RepID=UPI001C024154|nr:hypothetical protein [Secundilactobacillus kimchicus]MBT9670443.1 hypothetical protein [Secundilactobacillus kimchicus]